jgi:O-antigen/teichoic acid export membrane protein
VERSAVLSLAIGFCLILVTCGCGYPILKTWLGPDMPEIAPALMLTYGFYRSFQIYNTLIARALYAAEIPHKWFPMALGNALLTVGLAIPAVHFYKLLGLGYLNGAIALVMIAPAVYLLKRHLAVDLDVMKHLRQCGGIVLIGLVYALTGFFVTQLPFLTRNIWLGLLIWPILVGLAGLTMTATKLVHVPDALAHRLQLVSRWFKK